MCAAIDVACKSARACQRLGLAACSDVVAVNYDQLTINTFHIPFPFQE